MARTQLILLTITLLTLSTVITAADYDYCDVLHKSLLFYEAQRAGRLPSTNRVSWRGNSALNDCTANKCTKDSKGDGNLAGGYYDAGDGVKFALPMTFSMAMLAWGAIEYGDAIKDCGELDDYLDAIKWGTDWIIKAHTAPNEFWGQVGNGGWDHSFWGPPEFMTMQRPAFSIDTSKPGSDLAMNAAAALAAAAVIFKPRDSAYASLLVSHARELYSFGYTYRGKYSDSIADAQDYYNSFSGYNDDLAWGSSWMYRATGENQYLTNAKKDYDNFGIANQARGQSLDWDLKSPGVIMNMYKATGDSKYLNDANEFVRSWQKGNGVTYTPGGLAWLREWGPLRYTAGAAWVALLVNSPSSTAWGKTQIDYMLGSNPQSRSYVCGFGNNPPKDPHHRAAHGSSIFSISNPTHNKYDLVGALVGGPGKNDDYSDSRMDYVKNEVALDYNAAFTGALAALASSKSGSTPKPSTPKPATSKPATDAPTPQPSTPKPSTPKPPITSPTSAPVPATPRPPVTSPTSAPVTTPPPSGSGITFTVHSSSTPYWFAVMVDSAEVAKIELQDGQDYKSSWIAAEPSNWQYWIFTPTSGKSITLPVSFRVTSTSGKTATASNIVTSFTQSPVKSSASFSGSSTASPSTPSPSTPAPSTPTPSTPAPSTPAPSTPAPSTPAPSTPAPSTPAPSTPAPSTPAPSTPAPSTPAPAAGGVKVTIHSGASPYWFAIAVDADVSSITLKDSGSISSPIAFADQGWGYWIVSPPGGGAISFPATITLTSKAGKTGTATIAALTPSAVIDTGVRL